MYVKFYVSVNRILNTLCCVRQSDMRLVQAVERVELKKKYGAEFGKPTPRRFICPECKGVRQEAVYFYDKCSKCGYEKH